MMPKIYVLCCDGKCGARFARGAVSLDELRTHAKRAMWTHRAPNTDLCGVCSERLSISAPVTALRIYVVSDTQIAEWTPAALGLAQMNELAIRKLLGDEGNAWFHQELADSGSVLLSEFRARMATVRP